MLHVPRSRGRASKAVTAPACPDSFVAACSRPQGKLGGALGCAAEVESERRLLPPLTAREGSAFSSRSHPGGKWRGHQVLCVLAGLCAARSVPFSLLRRADVCTRKKDK